MRSRTIPFVLVSLLGLARSAQAQPPPSSDATSPAAPPVPSGEPAPTAPPPPAVSTATTPAPSAEPSVAQHAAVELTTLRLLREKNVITEAEYQSALRDLGESTGVHAADANTLVLGKWSTTMYGFVEADHIYDSTRSFADLAGNGQVARPDTLNGKEGRFQMGVRNSRIGFRLRAPQTGGVRTSATLEMDFLGLQLPIGSGAGTGSEGGFYTNPTFRVRHFNMKIETPVVDFLIGQYWQLFGWQSAYQPNTVEIQGVPGEVYSRTPQFRISKTFKTDPITFEAAIAATRPVQRDSGTPDGQAGLRFAVNHWTGVQTVGSTGTAIAPFSIAVTGYMRNVSVNEYSATPKVTHDHLMNGLAVDAFIPVIPGTKEQKGNSLSLNGELASGYGGADFYTGLTGGVSMPTPPVATGQTAPAYNIDPGIVTYDPSTGTLHGIQWTSYLVGLQYYFPGLDGRMWLSGNYSHTQSANAGRLTFTPKSVRSGEDWYDVNLFADVTPAVRIGLEYALFDDQYGDGTHAKNHRGQASFFYLF